MLNDTPSYRRLMRGIEQTILKNINAVVRHDIVSASLHHIVILFADGENKAAYDAALKLWHKWDRISPNDDALLRQAIESGSLAIETTLSAREKSRHKKTLLTDIRRKKKDTYHSAHQHALAAYAAITQRGDMAIMQDVAMRLVRATELLVNDFAAARKQLSALFYTQDADQRRIIGCLDECTRRWRMVVKIAAIPDRNKISDEDVRYIEQQIYNSSIDPSEEACLLADALAAARAVFFDHTRASNEKNNLGDTE